MCDKPQVVSHFAEFMVAGPEECLPGVMRNNDIAARNMYDRDRWWAMFLAEWMRTCQCDNDSTSLQRFGQVYR